MNDFHQELANGESEGIEFKRATSLLKEALDTVCFRQSQGGPLLWGCR